MTRTIVICFDNNTWMQENVEIEDSNDNFRFQSFIENYRKEYDEAKSSNPMLNLVAPSIIHIVML